MYSTSANAYSLPLMCIHNGLVCIHNGFFYDPQYDSQYSTLTLRTAAEHNCALETLKVVSLKNVSALFY